MTAWLTRPMGSNVDLNVRNDDWRAAPKVSCLPCLCKTLLTMNFLVRRVPQLIEAPASAPRFIKHINKQPSTRDSSSTPSHPLTAGDRRRPRTLEQRSPTTARMHDHMSHILPLQAHPLKPMYTVGGEYNITGKYNSNSVSSICHSQIREEPSRRHQPHNNMMLTLHILYH